MRIGINNAFRVSGNAAGRTPSIPETPGTNITLPATGAGGAIYSINAIAGSALPCCRIVRASDSAEKDIGYRTISRKIDIATAMAFKASSTDTILVKTWYDQSGNGNDATQTVQANMPRLLSNRTAIVFGTRRADNTLANAIPRYMNIPTGVAINRLGNTKLAVFASAVSLQGLTAYEFPANAQSDALLLSSSNAMSVRWYPGAVNDKTPVAKAVPEFYGMGTGTTGSGIYRTTGSKSTITAPTTLAMTGGYIGYTSVASAWNKAARQDYSLFAIYPSQLTDTQITDARTASIAAFSIPTTFDNNFVFVGDSITEGVYTDDNKTIVTLAMASVTASNKAIWNLGIAGQTMAQIVTGRAAHEAVLYSGSVTGKNVFHLWAGTNDIVAGSGTSAAAIMANIQTWVAAQKALGTSVRCVVGTCLPRTTFGSAGGAKDLDRIDLNNQIRSNASVNGYTVADYAADSVLGLFATTANTAIYPDGTHLSSTAYEQYAAPICAAAINSALAS